MKINRVHYSGRRPVCIRNSIANGDLITSLVFDDKDDIDFYAPAKHDEIRRHSNDILDFVGGSDFEQLRFDSLSDEKKAELLDQVAKRGSELFDALIADEDKEEFIKILHDHAGEDGAVSVRSTAVRVPWEFVYIKPATERYNPLGFLGQLYLLPRIAPPLHSPSRSDGSYRPYQSEGGKQTGTGKLDVGVIYDDWKDNKSSRHISSAWFSSRPHISVQALPQLTAAASVRPQMLDRLRTFLLQPVDSFLFTCGLWRTPRPSYSVDIRIWDRFEWRFADTTNLKLRGHDHLLVFLDVDYAAYNALSPAPSLAEKMHHNGAAVVVAPIGKVDHLLSEQLSDQFFQNVMGGQGIGLSLLFARRHILQVKSNPTALFWTAFGDVWTDLTGEGAAA
ncbi:hypothetical protein IVB38_06760 [Bradyrhizobium sp. 38]|uniref:hypothetical protein n=1 Tax=unclassified Bradyrhizobium TaxID=2631580 RepID=UPI001FF7B808|nr:MULTISPECIES: hypothetical protein [unclassified Bradyrhizobium]MCK1335741.1 hypothetical protein [Bradyrhizobium sp. 38]MCK1776965.1 hypothetical protein [Bradyrhizobium sp. 132]UPJ59746.1 hypothetical protein IVB24_08125 [Bradyrhizobium sp. 192]